MSIEAGDRVPIRNANGTWDGDATIAQLAAAIAPFLTPGEPGVAPSFEHVDLTGRSDIVSQAGPIGLSNGGLFITAVPTVLEQWRNVTLWCTLTLADTGTPGAAVGFALDTLIGSAAALIDGPWAPALGIKADWFGTLGGIAAVGKLLNLDDPTAPVVFAHDESATPILDATQPGDVISFNASWLITRED